MILSRLSSRALGAACCLALSAGAAHAAPCADGAISDLSVSVTVNNRIAPGVVVGDGRNQVALGDINNDGFLDVIVGFSEGAFGDVGAVNRRGVVRVFSGADGSLLREFTGNTWTTPAQLDGFGWRVGSADVNGDGFDDVLVGIRRFNNNAGRVVAYSGATGAPLVNFNGFGGDFGDTIVNLGDTNNDGRDDVLITLPSYNPQGAAVPPGAVAVFSGANGALIDSSVGGGLNPRLGRIAGLLGDVNDDAVPDLYVATNQSIIVFSSDDLAAGIWIRIVDQFGGAPLAAAPVGDLNSDGKPDLAVIRNGFYSVRSGATGDIIVAERAILPAGADVAMQGGVGDLNDDGVEDLVIVVRGGAAETEELLYLDAATGDVLARRVGPAYFDPNLGESDLGYGTGLAVGDVNNDGTPDVVVARRIEQYASAPFSEAIQALVYTSLPCVGDANGDGVVNFADLNTVLGSFGLSGIGVSGDTDCSQLVNFTDLNTVLGAFGSNCD